MKTLKIIAFFLTITLLSNCAFLPSIVMETRKSFKKLKNDFDVPPPPDFYEEEDTIALNEAPEMEAFDFESVECMEASLYLDNMRIVYVGVDNPCRIFVTNVPNQYIEVSSDNEDLQIIEKEGGFYTLIASKPGQAKITISAGYYEETYEVQLKRVPDPIAKLGIKEGGNMKISEFKTQGGIGAWLMNFDFDTRCVIESYAMTRIAKDGTQETVENEGSRFREAATLLQQKAQSGDIYIFEKVRSRCPGDNANRSINSLVFRIE